MNRVYFWLSWKLPRRLVYWCIIRAAAYATQEGVWEIDHPWDVTTTELIRRWGSQEGDELYLDRVEAQ